MTYKMTIPGRLPGLNEMINTARTNRYKAAEEKKEFTKLCSYYSKIYHIPPVQKPICIDVTWIEKNKKRDLDNISCGIKYILDGLQDSGVIGGDGWKFVYGIVHHFKTDNNEPRIVVVISDD